MAFNEGLPFPKTTYSEDYVSKGGTIGAKFQDSKGKHYRVFKLGTALINNVMAQGEAMVFLDAETVTNDVSAGLQGSTYPKAAGVADLGSGGTIAESTSTTEGSGLKFVLLLVGGIHDTLKTDGGDDIVAGDSLVPSTAADGACDRLTATTQTTGDYADADDDGAEIATAVTAALTVHMRRVATVFATALEDDVNATNVVKALIHCS